MKQLFVLAAALLLLFSACGNVRMIGKLNMASTRNVNTVETYVALGTYIELSKKQLRKARYANVDAAFDATIKSVPGGEYMMNIKMYLVNKKYFAVEGDVWGKPTNEYKGFTIGQRVQFKKQVGVVAGFADAENIMFRPDGETTAKKVPIDKLEKVF